MKHAIRVAALVMLASPLAAADLATGDQIMASISGNTVQGSMADGTAYTEFYEAGGVIKGVDYAGAWTVEGDQMCFDYNEGKTCWGVVIDGETVTWMNGDTPDGSGTIVAGNPNNF